MQEEVSAGGSKFRAGLRMSARSAFLSQRRTRSTVWTTKLASY